MDQVRRSEIIRQLAAVAATDDDGSKWVRRADALRIIGVAEATMWRWVKLGHVRDRRYLVDQDSGKSLRLTVVSLADLIVRVRTLQPANNVWTQTDDDTLVEYYGRESVEDVAQRLGRTVNAVKIRAKKIGVRVDSADGRYTLSDMAFFLRTRHEVVYQWCKRGMKHDRLPTTQKQIVIDHAGVLAFLRSNVWARHQISDAAMARLAAFVVQSQSHQHVEQSMQRKFERIAV